MPPMQGDAPTKSIAELVVDEEFTPQPEKVQRVNFIESTLERNRERRDELRAEDARLRSYPLDDDFENGTVLIWHRDIDIEYVDKHFAAVKDGGSWVVTGEWRTYPWDDLVVTRLRTYDWSDVEVVHPPQPQ